MGGRVARKKIAKATAPINQLVAKFEHTLDPKKAKELKTKIEFRRQKAFTEQQKSNAADTALSHAKYKSKYHKEVLKRQKVLAPPSKKTIIQRTKKMRTHVGMVATAAHRQAVANRILIKKISKFASARAVAAARAKAAA